MADVVDIYKLALSAAGTKASVTTTTERSREAEVCTLWYATVRDQVLRAARWPSTRAYKRLALAVERDVDVAWLSSDPSPGWRFRYSAPTDMLAPRHMSDFTRFMLTTSVDNSVVIDTQTEDAVLTYTKRQERVDAWDPELKMAIVYALAAHICLPLHGKVARAREVADQANQLIMNARVSAANTDENHYESIPEWLTARGYAGNSPALRYFYPYGGLIAVTEGVGVT